MHAAAAGGVVERHDRWSGPTVPAVVGDDGPEPAGLRRPAPRVSTGARVSSMKIRSAAFRWVRICSTIGLRWKQARPTQLPKGRPVERNPLPLVDLGLAVEWQVGLRTWRR